VDVDWSTISCPTFDVTHLVERSPLAAAVHDAIRAHTRTRSRKPTAAGMHITGRDYYDQCHALHLCATK
jgi:hypothetical protein